MADIKSEPWYKSRRMWSGVLAGIGAVLIQFGYGDVATAVIAVAGSFGITSWVKPEGLVMKK